MHHTGNESVLRQLTNSSSAPWLVVLPGTMRGVYSGGQVTALEQRSLTKGFAGVIGVSTGSPVGAYFVADQAELGTSIYYEECTTPEFISLSRYIRGGHGADITYLGSVFERGPKRLDEERIHASATELYFGVTEHATGHERYVDAKKVEPNIVHGIKASAAIPGLYRNQLFIDGVRCVDGGAACRPIREALSKRPTGIVVFANCGGNHCESLVKTTMTKVVLRNEPKPIQEAMRIRHVVGAEDIQLLEQSGIPHIVIYCDSAVGGYTRNAAVLKAAAERACRHMHDLLDRAGVP